MHPGYPKTTQIPIGLAPQYWPHGDKTILLEEAKAAPAWDERPTTLFVAMDSATNHQRSRVITQLSQISGAKIAQTRLEYHEYLQQLATAKFVAAPPGNGMDTIRLWEVR